MKSAITRFMGKRYSAVPRRGFLKGLGAVAAAGFWSDQDLEAWQTRVNTNSRPSDLKITDMRVAVVKDAPMRCPIIFRTRDCSEPMAARNRLSKSSSNTARNTGSRT